MILRTLDLVYDISLYNIDDDDDANDNEIHKIKHKIKTLFLVKLKF